MDPPSVVEVLAAYAAFIPSRFAMVPQKPLPSTALAALEPPKVNHPLTVVPLAPPNVVSREPSVRAMFAALAAIPRPSVSAMATQVVLLLGICFSREAPETTDWPGRRAGERGLVKRENMLEC